MNATAISKRIKKLGILVLTVFMSALVFAQEASAPAFDVTSTSTKITSEEWFTNPIYWMIGGLIFIIIIALIVRGNGRKG
jgi:hypothetical protein